MLVSPTSTGYVWGFVSSKYLLPRDLIPGKPSRGTSKMSRATTTHPPPKRLICAEPYAKLVIIGSLLVPQNGTHLGDAQNSRKWPVRAETSHSQVNGDYRLFSKSNPNQLCPPKERMRRRESNGKGHLNRRLAQCVCVCVCAFDGAYQ